MDIRLATVCVVRKNSLFLVGRIIYSEQLRWSTSPHDAWKTKDRAEAESVARMVGDIVMLFNPIAGQLRVL